MFLPYLLIVKDKSAIKLKNICMNICDEAGSKTVFYLKIDLYL